MFRPLIFEHFWDTRGTLWDMSWNTLGHVLGHPRDTLGHVLDTLGHVLEHFGTCPETCPKSVQYFDRIFEMHEFGMVGGPKYYFFNILIQSNIPEQYGPVGTRIEQYGFSSSSALNEVTLSLKH